MAIATLKELIEAGVHFGCRTALWDPRMKSFIHSKRKGIYIIDLKKTLEGLIRTSYFLRKVASSGKKVLFVGTKRQAGDIVREEAKRSGSYFVASRWLGGTLTNMTTMRERVKRLLELEELEKTGDIQNFSKKMVSTLTRERKKIWRNFEGTRDMRDLPGAMVVVDPKQEKIAIQEAMRLNIPVIVIADTDANPEDADFVIPANDDSTRSLRCILSKLADAINDGSKQSQSRAVIDAAVKEKDAAEADDDAGADVPQDFSNVTSFSMGGDDDDEK